MKIISIANQKGGCGKTTTAINLAAALGLNGKRVMLLDLDPQAHASLGLDIESQDSLYNVISNLTPRKLKIENIIKSVEGIFDIVPSNILVGTLEQELADEIGRELKLTEILKAVEGQYDYVLIDCPPSLGILTVNALRASNELIIPVETSRFSMQGVDHLTDIVNLVKDRLNHTVKSNILVTMFDSRLRHSFAMLSTFKERFTGLLFDTIIHINVKLKESAVMGKPVSSYDKYCRGSKDYYSLAKEMISIEAQEERRLEEAQETAQEEDEPKDSRIEKVVRAIREAQEEQKVAKEQRQEVKAQEKEAKAVAKEDAAKAEEKSAETKKPRVKVTPEAKEAPDFKPLSDKMKAVVKKEVQDLMETKFWIDAAGAKSVYVTGSFNDWSLDENCRLKNNNGRWEASIPLKGGVYKYQFIVDGVWREDPNNPRKERNSFGDINSLVEVSTDGQTQAV